MSTFITSLIPWIARRLRVMAASLREAAPAAQKLYRKPSVAGYVAARAYHVQFALAVALLVLIYIAPTVVDSVTSTFFPGQSSEKLFGLIKTSSQSPAKEFLDPFLMTLLWVGAISWVLFLLWRHLPTGLARAEATSKALAEDAISLSDTDRARALALFRRARSLTVDSDREIELTARLEELGEALAPHSSQRPTVVQSPERTPGSHSAKRDPHAVGRDGRYRLDDAVGKGSMGEVYRGRDTVLDREVALKQLSFRLLDDEQYAERFRHEAKALARLTHPNIVQVYDFVEEEHRLWMVLELVNGGDLEVYLEGRGRLPVSEAASLIHQAACGLAHAHAAGIVHRDLKPGNMLLTPEKQIKITDFGIAKVARSTNLTQEGSVLGSPPYMSPEQASGAPVDSHTDIYSLGITFYEMLTGQVPFDGDTSSVLAKHIIDTPKPPSELAPDLPPAIEKIVLHMLAKQPDQRPEDMNTVAAMLTAYTGAQPAPAPQRS